jgi:hypothetical protein
MAHGELVLSVVATTRNDDHGGSLLRRTQAFVTALIGQCQRHGLAAELILVEWNPPPDRPRLAQALRWPADPSPCQVRIVEVPPHLHARFQHAQALPLFQMIAKNVGIRRARAPFVLCTNIDILLSDALVRFLASGGLKRGHMYRLDRHDVGPDVPAEGPVAAQLAYCEGHLLRVNARDGVFRLTAEGLRALEAKDIAAAGDGIHFGEGWFGVENWDGEILRWISNDAELLIQPQEGPARALVLEVEPGPGVDYKPFWLQVRDGTGQAVARGLIECRQQAVFVPPLKPGQTNRFTLHVEGGGRPVAEDPRTLNFRVLRCFWRPADDFADVPGVPGAFNLQTIEVGTCLPEDITPVEAGIRFGRGWHPLERWEGRPLRWATNEARLLLAPIPAGPPRALTLEMHPGFGVNFKPFELKVLNHRGEIVARGRVDGRQLVSILLPRRGAGQLTLRVDGGDLPTPGDTRLLTFCVWRCGWAPAWSEPVPPNSGTTPFNFRSEDVGALACEDIVTADMGISFGRGWHYVERTDSERFRWVEDDAGLFLEAPAGAPRALRLVVKPGPGVVRKTFGLEVRNRAGQVLARGQVRGRQAITLSLPLTPGQTERVTLHVQGGGRRVPSDPRLLNFRVFRCDWVPSDETPAPADSPGTFNFRAERAPEPVGLPTRVLRRAGIPPLGETLRNLSIVRWFQSRLAKPIPPPVPISIPTEGGSSRVSATPNSGEEEIICPVHLHTYACGDFTLMAKEHWDAIRGYPEFQMYSMHIDSLGCYMAYHAGAREVILREPMRIYHIEHGQGSGWTPEGEAKLFGRLAAQGIPWLDYRQLCRWATQMRREGRPLIFNGPDWGLANEDLPETIIGKAGRSLVA